MISNEINAHQYMNTGYAPRRTYEFVEKCDGVK